MIDTADLRLSLFEPLVGQVFQLRYPGHEDDLTLVEAVETKDRSGKARAAGCFVLRFDGANRERMLAQGIHRLTHGTLGAMEMVLVPRARNPDGTIRYSADFN